MTSLNILLGMLSQHCVAPDYRTVPSRKTSNAGNDSPRAAPTTGLARQTISRQMLITLPDFADIQWPILQKDRKLLVERICQQCGQYFCTKKRAEECHGHHTAHETPTRILTLRGREVLCVVREDDDAE
ncbi:hypothetical protein EVAR_36047_1 [Eumeta japonica]|uniref:Uncharacterized protein n=1 Tax=Eumeta variegata TaxID=151549 RepID=A0A4C1WU45_EUMVA|nr:hypothetical protein EVAR_36047_1 [Eumeta japonica]